MDPYSFLSKDKVLAPLIEAQGKLELELRDKIYLRLCSSIISQQLSTKVAAVIYGRFLDIFNGQEPSLDQVLELSVSDLKAIGCSNAKANYILNVCNFFKEQGLTDEVLHEKSDDEILKLFTSIKGVGKWTAEMILMFSLGREDIFAFDDLGLRKMLLLLYDLDDSDKKLLRQQMEAITNQWKPFRSYASLYLWGFKDS